MRISVTACNSQMASDILIRADDSTSESEFDKAMSAALGVPTCLPLAIQPTSGVDSHNSDMSIMELGLRNGQRVGIAGFTPSAETFPDDGLQLHVVGGPSAGLVFSLPQGTHEIGRAGTISLPDRKLSRRHAQLTIEHGGIMVMDLGSSNGTFLDGEPVGSAEGVPIKVGSTLQIGDTLLEIRPAHTSDAAVEAGEPGWFNYMRPPRILSTFESTTIHVPQAPQKPAKRRFPVVAIIAPIIMGVVMVLLTKSMFYALFMLLSPIMMVFNTISDKRTGVNDYKEKLVEYHSDLQNARDDLAKAIKAETMWRRSELPDAAATLMTCVLPDRRLWERRRADPDALMIRLGTSTQSSTITVVGSEEPVSPALTDVPVATSLRDHPIIGLAGPDTAIDPLLRWVIAQIAAYHPPRDLTCSFVSAQAKPEDWNWLPWLPHLHPDTEDGPLAYIYIDNDSVTAYIAALASMVKDRLGAVSHLDRVDPSAFPTHILIVRHYRQLRAVPGLGTILDDGPQVGIHVICTEDSERFLPEECSATLVCDDSDPVRATLRQQGEQGTAGVLVEGVTPAWCDRLARQMACLVDAGAEELQDGLPTSSRLLDVIGLDPPTPMAIQLQWASTIRTTQAVIGEGLDGVFAIDIRQDGPHGLIAGTTGSGKSELLQTIIASLAVGNRPDEMCFVLIDYKGGAAFKDCEKLPHTVGMVTDLDGHLTNRALASLKAELHRREHQLAAAGCKDIEDYIVAQTPTDEPMPRLLIVIDEFAALVQELPDFVTGLIDIARRGRSLGVHLLLATQRPAGVVNADIKSNTNLRIALRVTDVADSSDVIEAPDAAFIPKTTPGRAYARLGHSSLVAFQSARVGGRPPGTLSNAVPSVWPFTLAEVGHTPPEVEGDDSEEANIPTDLACLVDATRQASATASIPSAPPPWLPALGTVITLDQILDDFPSAESVESSLVIPIGMTDLPDQQQRGVGTFDIRSGTHLSIIGTARSGRSTVLRTIAGAIGRYCSLADVHMYGVDCGNNALLPLVGLPHVGAVVTRDQPDRMARLANLLQRTVSQRQQILAQSGYADLNEQRSHVSGDKRLPYILVLFDNWDAFVHAYEDLDSGQLLTAWQQILQEGLSVGVRVIMTGDRSLLAGRMATLFPDRLMLRMLDPSDYSHIGMRTSEVPSSMPPGRGFRSSTATETQIALLVEESEGTAQVAAIHSIAARARARWDDLSTEFRPKRVDILPSQFGIAQIKDLPHSDLSPTEIPIAVGGDTLSLQTLDAIDHGPGFFITGPRRSGRSTTLQTLGVFALQRGWNVVMITPRISALRRFHGNDHLYGPYDTSSSQKEVTELLASLRDAETPSLTLVDDLEILGTDGWLHDLLVDHLTAIRDTGSVLAGAGTPTEIASIYRGLIALLKKARSGVMLSPQGTQDTDLFGIAMPRSAFSAVPPGGGFLIRVGGTQRVQVIDPRTD